MSAKINGSDWYATDADQSGGFFFGSDIELNNFSDDEYFIGFVMNDENTIVAEYNFNENSTVDRISFSKYDPSTNGFIEYETSGIFNISEKNVGLQFTQIIGTYSLTATNGTEVIQVTEGQVNTVYQNY